MIVKISARGSDPGKLMNYLASDKNLHCQQRIVAGSVQYPGHLDKQLVSQVAAELRSFQQLTGTHVPRGHIYHVTLSLSPDDRALSDNEWESLSNDFMTGMGFEDPNKAAIKWTAVNHGANAAGADHVHIVMSTVRQNGTQVSVHNDMKRASKLATQLEDAYGLKVLQSRMASVGAGSVPYTGKEVERAREQQKVEPDRVTLEREIRALAAASTTEAEFIRRVKADGILIRPFPNNGAITGYSVAEPSDKPQWFGGGKLARDLTLPQLRRRWDSSGKAAEAEWRGTAPTRPGRESLKVSLTPKTMAELKAELGKLSTKVRTADPDDLAELSHEVAGTLAAASKAIETVPGPLAKASREVGGWAQPRVLGTEKRPASHASRGMALLLVAAMNPGSEQAKAIMLRQLAEMVIALYRLHRAARPVVASGRGTRMEADGFDDAINDGVTVGVTAAATATASWAQGRAERKGAVIDGPRPSAPGQPWDASTIRNDRVFAAVEQTKRNFVPPPERATPQQVERISELAGKFELPGVAEAAAGLPKTQVERLINDFEASAQGWDVPVKPDLPQTSPTMPTGLATVTTPEEASAFLARLERNAEARDSQVAGRVVDGTVAPPEQATTPTEVAQQPPTQGNKDPRLNATANDPVTSKQRWTLKEAGFTADEIATLNKGSASFVIGATDHRKAFDRNAADAVRMMPSDGQQRSQRKPADVRKQPQMPAMDIRNRPRRPQ